MTRLRFAGMMLRGLLLAGAVAIAVAPASAQVFGKEVELSLNYTPTIANVTKGQCGCFLLQGGGAEGTLYLVDRLAIATDLTLVHANHVNGADYGLTMGTFMAGPRLVFRGVHTKYTPYAQAMFGGAYAHSVFPGTTSGAASSYAMEFGGGLEMNYKKRIGIRLFEADYLLTGLPNNGNNKQSNLKLAAGVVFKFR